MTVCNISSCVALDLLTPVSRAHCPIDFLGERVSFSIIREAEAGVVVVICLPVYSIISLMVPSSLNLSQIRDVVSRVDVWDVHSYIHSLCTSAIFSHFQYLFRIHFFCSKVNLVHVKLSMNDTKLMVMFNLVRFNRILGNAQVTKISYMPK